MEKNIDLLRDKFGRFKKGMTPINKGSHLSQEHKDNLSISHKGKKLSKNHKENIRKSLKGREMPWIKGKKFPNRKRHVMTEEHKKKILFKKGQRPWNYIDGRSKLFGPVRYGDDWFKIRELVLRRDNYTCQDCGVTQKILGKWASLHIHHIQPFLMSFDNSLNNLLTLCPSCHRKEEVRLMRELKQIKVEV